MANVYKIAFDDDSEVYADRRVNYYVFDAIMLTDGSHTQVIKTDFNPTKIYNGNLSFIKTLDNGQQFVKYETRHRYGDLHQLDGYYLPFTDKPQTINLDLEKLKLKALMYNGHIINNITFQDTPDNNIHGEFDDTIILEVHLKAPINNIRRYKFDWIENQGWTIDNPLFNDSHGSHKLIGEPLQLVPYNKDTGLILNTNEQYDPIKPLYDPNDSSAWLGEAKPTSIYPLDGNSDSTAVIDEWLSPQNPNEVTTKDKLGYVLAPSDVSVPDNISDLISNINKKYTHTFYWDPRPVYDPDKYDKRSFVSDGIIYPLNDTFYVNFLNSPYFSIPLAGVLFDNPTDSEKHENDTIDIEILLNNVVISTQTVNVFGPVLQPIDAITFNNNHDVAEKPTIDLQTNSLNYSIERITETYYKGQNYDEFQITYNPYPTELSGYHANEKTLEKTVPVVGSFVAVNNIDKNIPVLSIQSIDFITGDIILSNNSTRKLTD